MLGQTYQRIADYVESNLLKTFKPATVKCYLLSLYKFGEFAKLCNVAWMSGTEADRMRDQIKLWNASLQKDIVICNAERQVQEYGKPNY